jgi:hypothetical protein
MEREAVCTRATRADHESREAARRKAIERLAPILGGHDEPFPDEGKRDAKNIFDVQTQILPLRGRPSGKDQPERHSQPEKMTSNSLHSNSS